MGSEAPLKIPIIDFSDEDLISGTDNWVSVRAQACKALEEYGCFEAVYDRLPLELHNAFFGAMEELFHLPLETKQKNTSSIPYFGYIPLNPGVSLYESLAIDEAIVPERVQDFTKLMWPEGNESFCELVNSFVSRIFDLNKTVTRMVFESYGVETYHDDHMKSTIDLLRIIKYRGPRMDETKVGAYSHTDKTFISILHQNQINGLEVQTKNGEWISVTPSANSFVVMIGDVFFAWSNGRLHSPHHRVIMNGDITRFSTGLFTFSKGIVQVPEELVDEEHPLIFKPFNNVGLLHFFCTPEGQKAESTVKAYCGV